MESRPDEEVTEQNASVLTGLTRDELRWICRQVGLGHPATGDPGEMRFSYEELGRICALAARAHL